MNMNSILNMQKSVDFIEEQLGEEISIEALAKEATLSTFYFQRLFTKTSKMTVMEYIKKRRLTVAVKKIYEKTFSITEISYAVGYKNYEQFSRDFKNEFSIPPSEFRKQNTNLKLEPKIDFRLIQKFVREDEITIFDEMSICINVVYSEDMYAVGVSKLCGLTKGIDDPGLLQCYFNDEMKANIPNQISPPIGFGIGLTNYIQDNQRHGFTYIAARQVATFINVPDEFTKFIIPAGLYAICRVEAENFDKLVNEVIYKVGDYMLNTWLSDKNSKYAFAGEMIIEKYYTTSDSDGTRYFDYCFPVVKKKL